MTIALIADLHVANHRRHSGPVTAGINRRCQQVLDALDAAVQLANRRECKALVVLGDLFDTTRPEPQIVAATQKAFARSDAPVYVLMGNHDLVSTAPGDHALGPLEPVPNVTVMDKPTWLMPERDKQLLFVPFQPGPAVEWLPKVVEEVAAQRYHMDTPAALLLHLGLASDDTPTYLRGSHDAVPAGLVAQLCKDYGFAACFAGNWHSHKVLRKRPPIVQVGALAPTGFDNLGLHDIGTMVFWARGAKWEVEQIPGPRFIKVRAGEQWPDAPGCSVYVQVIAGVAEVAGAVKDVDEMASDGLIAGGEVIPDAKEVREAARKAATIARAADTLEEALQSYIEHMPLADGIDRAELLARAKHYLGTGG